VISDMRRSMSGGSVPAASRRAVLALRRVMSSEKPP
jgi:hypothetical protein